MKRRLIIIIVLCVVLIGSLITYKFRQHLMDSTPALDRDFVATISSTDTPMVFEIEIKKVNKRPQKQIHATRGVIVDFVLEDSNGKVLKSKNIGTPEYAESVGRESAFDSWQGGPVDYLKDKIKLRTASLKPGVYKVRPMVRIWEVGPDSMKNPPAHGSPYVAILAGNSVEITLPVK